MRRIPLTRLAALAGLAAVALLASGCGVFSGPQNTFSPSGEQAEDLKNIYLITMWPALAILTLVWAGIVYIILRYRRKRADEPLPVQLHGNTRLELAWTIAPALLLAAFIPPVVSGIVNLEENPKDALVVDVTGIQWAWTFTYPGLGPDGADVEAPINELHIPTGRRVLFRLHSPDVIHSFWIPKLGGKTDVMPGHNNTMWLQADEPGTYSGQCAEFCGLSHANMRFIAVAESPEEFDAWLQEQVAAQSGTGDEPQVVQGD